MGQQQILILILVLIIVGIAIIVALNVFKSEEVSFLESEYTQQMIEVSEEAQAWYIRPTQLGGGGKDFKGLDWNKITCPIGVADPTQASLCQDPESQNYMIIENLFPGSALIRAYIFVGDDEYNAKMVIYPNEIEWSIKWEKK